MATVFEPIRPVPPITTIFIGYPACRRFKAQPWRKISVDFRTDVNTEAVGLVQLNSATLGEFGVPAAGMYRESVAGKTPRSRRCRDWRALPWRPRSRPH